MNSGAEDTADMVFTIGSTAVRSSDPDRMWCRGVRPVQSRRMPISLRLISRLKVALVRPCLMLQERAKSSRVWTSPSPVGRDGDHLPGVQTVGEFVGVDEPGPGIR